MIEKSSGNVFRDLGLPNPDRLLAEAKQKRKSEMSNTCITCGQVVPGNNDVVQVDKESLERISAALDKYAIVEITDGDMSVWVELSDE